MFYDVSRTMHALDGIHRSLERAVVGQSFGKRHVTEPSYHIFKLSSESYAVKVALPGVRKENIRVTIKGRDLSFHAERQPEVPGDEAKVRWSERSNQALERSISLPFQIDAEKTLAEYKDGILTITLQQAESERERQITIN